MRRYVIGDIHGCSKALRTLIDTIQPSPDDHLIFLGDYIDRGPDSRNVVQQVLDLHRTCRVTALRGNHELMLLAILDRGFDESLWLGNGGRSTLTSYGGKLSKIPTDHLRFFHDLDVFYEGPDLICVHAGYQPTVPMTQQNEAVMYWDHMPAIPPPPHSSGKRVFIGHTPQPYGNVFDAGHLVCIDTYCFGGGYLTAYEVDTDQAMQVDHHGHLRRDSATVLGKRMAALAASAIRTGQKWLAGRSASAESGSPDHGTERARPS